jgi:hypothetical protein
VLEQLLPILPRRQTEAKSFASLLHLRVIP